MWTEDSALPVIELHTVASFVRAVMWCTPRPFVYFELNDFHPRGWWALFRILDAMAKFAYKVRCYCCRSYCSVTLTYGSTNHDRYLIISYCMRYAILL